MKFVESRLRIATGIVLALYLTQHLINHATGIFSIEAAEYYRHSVGEIFQTWVGQILLYASLLFHAIIAFRSIYRRASFRISMWQWVQLLLGLSILPLLAAHVIGTRGFHILGGIDPNYYYVVTSMVLKPIIQYKLMTLLLVVWIHMAVGLHYWLRGRRHYAGILPYAYALVILIPAMAYAGLFSMTREAASWADNSDRLREIYAPVNRMDGGDIAFLYGLETQTLIALAIILLSVIGARQIRLWWLRRKGTYFIIGNDGLQVRGLTGISLLEALRQAGIPHASICGGRARCTTCRVRVGEGLRHLHPANKLEQLALNRIGAPEDIRLACQIFPLQNLSITPLVLANHPISGTSHSGGVQGHEEYVVAMFVDMRGSTSLGERVLAYDVVFILNRFFTELSAALAQTHGHYAQFAGDGLMALYGLDVGRKNHACTDALAGAREMFRRIQILNLQLHQEFGESIVMGIGIHGGEAIVGTMGPPKTPLLTAIGDSINIAARLESQTKTLGCDLIVSLETLARESISYPDDSVQDLEVKGRVDKVQAACFQRTEIPEPTANKQEDPDRQVSAEISQASAD